MPRRAKRSTPEAATTASRSASRAGREKSSTVQSDRPKPRSSYRTTVASAPSWSRKWRQTGLCQSYWRWLSQHEATTSGGPLPWIAYASRTPSAARQNLMSWCVGSDDPSRGRRSGDGRHDTRTSYGGRSSLIDKQIHSASAAMRRPTWRRLDPHLGPGRRSATGGTGRVHGLGVRSAADPAHPRDARPARSELLGARAGHPPAGRPRRPRGSTRPTCCRTSPTRWSRCCRRSRTTPARSAVAAASSPGCARGRGSATSPSTSRSSSRTSPARTSATARRAAPGKVGQYNCIFEYREEAVGLEAGRMAVALVNHLVAPDDPDVFFDFAPELERLIRLAERQAFGPSTQALIDEAVSRDIPFIRLDRHSLVQFGHGVHQQRIRATMTSLTSAIGVDVASDKSLTNGCSTRPGCRSRGPTSSTPRTARSRRPSGSASRAWSSRSTATTAAASTSTCAPRRRSGPRSTAPSPRAAAATSSSRRTWPATTTAAWSSAARSRPSPSASRRR